MSKDNNDQIQNNISYKNKIENENIKIDSSSINNELDTTYQTKLEELKKKNRKL